MFREGQLEKIFGFNREESGDGLAQWETSYINRMIRSGRMIRDGHKKRMVELRNMWRTFVMKHELKN
jgi:hypothetical protein